MWRICVGAAGALLIGTGLFAWWRAGTHAEGAVSPPAVMAQVAPLPETMPEAPSATREEKRFNRYDKDRNGDVTRDEYLASRRKAFARLDRDGNGRLGFDEWSAKTLTKFASADVDRSGQLTRAEFASTRVERKTRRSGCAE